VSTSYGPRWREATFWVRFAFRVAIYPLSLGYAAVVEAITHRRSTTP